MTAPSPPPGALHASDVMEKYVVVVRSNASITEAWHALFSTGSTHLIVVDGQRCLGVVDDRTIALEWPGGAFESRRRQMTTLCHAGPATIGASATVQQVAAFMDAQGLTAVAVVNDAGRPVGIVTAANLVAVLARGPVTTPPALDGARPERAG